MTQRHPEEAADGRRAERRTSAAPPSRLWVRWLAGAIGVVGLFGLVLVVLPDAAEWVFALVVYQTWALIHYVNRSNRDLARFLLSIKHSDFAATFPDDGKGGSCGSTGVCTRACGGGSTRTAASGIAPGACCSVCNSARR